MSWYGYWRSSAPEQLVAYAVYHFFFAQDYLEDFEDDFEDEADDVEEDDDDFFEDEGEN